MTVKRLIQLLEQFDDENAEVKLMTQQNWPFENRLLGVCERSDLMHDPEDEGRLRADQKPDDVFLVEGSQLGYGDKDAWDYLTR